MGSWRGRLHSCVASLPLWCCSEKTLAAPPLHLAIVIALLLLLMVLQQAVPQPWSLVDPLSVLHLQIDTVICCRFGKLGSLLLDRFLVLVYQLIRLGYLPEQTKIGLAEAISLPHC